MDEMRFREMSRQRDNKLWNESRFEDPNHGDDLSRQCPDCECFEEGWDTIEKHGLSGVLVRICPCGWKEGE